jgi:CHASE3 domain sensor protein
MSHLSKKERLERTLKRSEQIARTLLTLGLALLLTLIVQSCLGL